MAKGNHSHFGENMRNVHFRSRTFVLIGIALVGFAAFSYWGLSTQNGDLLVKIEQLEDNIKIGSRKQRDLEDELQAMVKKSNELQKTNAKLQSELMQKENVITAQGAEGSQWRDKVRNAEAEVEKFKTDLADKTKKLLDLQKQVATYTQDILLKDSKLTQAEETVKKFKLQLESLGVHNFTNQISNGKSQSTSSSSAPVADPSNVLAKPNNEKPEEEEEEKKVEKRQESESVVGRPIGEREEAVKPDEELELLDPKENAVEHPEAENDETKFKEIREEMDIGEPERNNAVAEDNKSKEGNEANEIDAIRDPNLINSQDDNLDDEPALADINPRFRNFKARVMHKKQEDDDNNMPEDQEVENEHDDDRGDN